jgi:hypothetical protein
LLTTVASAPANSATATIAAVEPAMSSRETPAAWVSAASDPVTSAMIVPIRHGTRSGAVRDRKLRPISAARQGGHQPAIPAKGAATSATTVSARRPSVPGSAVGAAASAGATVPIIRGRSARATTAMQSNVARMPGRAIVRVLDGDAAPAKSRVRLPRANRASSQAARSWRPVRVLSAESQSTAVGKHVSGIATASAGSTTTLHSQPGSEVPTGGGYPQGRAVNGYSIEQR